MQLIGIYFFLMILIQELIDFSRKFLSEERNDKFIKSLPKIEQDLMHSLVVYSAEELNLTSKSLDKEELAASYRIIEKLKKHILQYLPKSNIHNAYQVAFYKANLNLICVKYLYTKQYRKSAIKIAEQTFRISSKFGFNDISLDLGRKLFLHYNTYTSKQKLGEKYYNHVLDIQNALDLEIKSEWYFSELANEFSINKNISDDFKKKSKRFFKILSPAINKINSSSFHKFSFLVGVYAYLAEKDYNNCAKHCLHGVRYFTEHQHHKNIFSANIMRNYLSYSYLAENKLDEAYSVLLDTEKSTEKNKAQWFNTQTYLFLIDLRRQNLLSSAQRLQSVFEGRAIQRQSTLIINRWKLFEAYHYLLVGLKQKRSRSIPNQTFKIGKFINETFELSKDKKAMNVSIRICQFLFNLTNQQYDKMIDSEESLKSYAGRHLVKNKSFRNNCFIKMLLVISKQNFHPEAVARHSEKYRKKLAEVPLKFDGGSDLVEIIPFEQLWDLVLMYLMKQQKVENPRYEALHPYLKNLASTSSVQYAQAKDKQIQKQALKT